MTTRSFLKGLFLVLIVSASVQAQTFEEWKQQQQEAYQAYKDEFDQEFISMLKTTWEEVGISIGSRNYEDDKPNELPFFEVPPPKPDVDITREENRIIEEKITIDLDFDFDDEPFELPKPKPVAERDEGTRLFDSQVNTVPVSLSYFSNPVSLSYPQMIKERLNPRDYRSGDIDNNKIAEFWDVVSSVNHTDFVNHTLSMKESMGLNDWGYVLLVNDISKSIFGAQNVSLVRMMNWFILTKAGYQNKVGYDQNGVYNLFTVSNNIFNAQYYTLDGNKYFPINFNEEYQTPSSIFTYQGDHGAQVRKLDLSIDTYPSFINPNQMIEKELVFSFQGEEYNIPVVINREVISYFEYYPLTDLPVFFSASLSSQTKQQLYAELAPILEGMGELQAVNFLLRLVQTAFDYKTDQDQFDREKYMMPEEILFYPYSDCDDRSIFFATLVEELLGLDAVGLRYSRHLAVAVEFKGDVEGDFHMSEGRKYTVADPTYINAPAGMTMNMYRDETPSIIHF